MKLYHHPFSSNARKALMTAHLLEVPLDVVFVDLQKGASRTPEYLAMNPNGKVPVLDDDGFLLWESHAIMQYLADKTPGNALYPRDLRARADVDRWLFWCSHHLSPALAILMFERVLKKKMGLGETDPVHERRGEAAVADCAKLLDAHFEGRDYAAGEALTLADVALATPFMYAPPVRFDLTSWKNLTRWLGRVQELDAWKKTNPPA